MIAWPVMTFFICTLRGSFHSTLLLSCAIIVLSACQPKETERPVSILWKENKAVGLTIRKVYPSEEDIPALQVRLVRKGERAPVLGSFTHTASDVTFVPLVPLTRGMTYEILEEGIVFGEIAIPASDKPAPAVLAIYPLHDTVPENLLKVYLRFSQSMMEGRSAAFVHLLKDGRDTMKGTFLDLQPELWNGDGTVLTLWLDPGRIKLDLIPNKEMGNPLTRGELYELVVGAGWRSKAGVPSEVAVRKLFHVGKRDDQSPNINLWSISVPSRDTRNMLTVDFHEPLDRLLAEETITVIDGQGNPVKGKLEVTRKDSRFEFVPDAPWPVGTFFLTAESRLEDLSGNNLNRLFEIDLSKAGAEKEDRATYRRQFIVK